MDVFWWKYCFGKERRREKLLEGCRVPVLYTMCLRPSLRTGGGTAGVAVQDKVWARAACLEAHSDAQQGLLSSAPQWAQLECTFAKVQVVLSISS